MALVTVALAGYDLATPFSYQHSSGGQVLWQAGSHYRFALLSVSLRFHVEHSSHGSVRSVPSAQWLLTPRCWRLLRRLITALVWTR